MDKTDLSKKYQIPPVDVAGRAETQLMTCGDAALAAIFKPHSVVCIYTLGVRRA